MPARIYIIYRIILTIHIQMQRIRLIQLSPICVFRQESPILRIIVSRIQVVKSSRLIIDSARVADYILERTASIDLCLSEK